MLRVCHSSSSFFSSVVMCADLFDSSSSVQVCSACLFYPARHFVRFLAHCRRNGCETKKKGKKGIIEMVTGDQARRTLGTYGREFRRRLDGKIVGYSVCVCERGCPLRIEYDSDTFLLTVRFHARVYNDRRVLRFEQQVKHRLR